VEPRGYSLSNYIVGLVMKEEEGEAGWSRVAEKYGPQGGNES